MNHRAQGSTLLISTHLIDDVDYIFDEVIFMAEGQVVLHEEVSVLLSTVNKRLEEVYKEVMRDAYNFKVKCPTV